MNVKDILFVMVMAFITTWAFEYFFFGKKPFQSVEQSAQSGQFQAPEHKRELKPLNHEIDFIDTRQTMAPIETQVETRHAVYVFSTEGATLDHATFKQARDGKELELTTIHPAGPTEKEKRCFLVALNEKTPFYYTLDEQREGDGSIIITYKAETPEVSIVKTFEVFKYEHKIDLKLEVHPKKSTIEPRIIFPSPFMSELRDQERLSAIVTNEHGAVVVERTLTKLEDTGWFEPTLFGTANKYFVHAMVGDKERFAQRAYYNQEGAEHLITFLEGPTVHESRTWNISFYMGPKTEESMRRVDPRLEKTLDYAGWLTPISQALLKLMQFLYGYLHNYGLVIIAVTLLLKLILLPFTLKSNEKAKEHAEFQRKMAYIQKKYKHDPETLKAEQAALVQKYGLPGLGGCLPMLIQLPIFFALNPILNSSLDLYKAPFLWIPDLSARDPYFILPILIVVFMVIQASTLDKQGRIPALAVALLIAAVSINFAAGLSLYILTSAVLGLLQTMIQKKVS